MKNLITIGILLISISFGKVNIVASTTDLADIAKSVGGDKVKVTSIARGNQDPHYVEVLPSYMMKVKRADMYLQVGMELDLWSRQIIDGSRNRDLQIVDCSENINRLEVPTDKIDASMGDIHSMGNPHYWLDPENGKIIAKTILNALISDDISNADYYQTMYDNFVQNIDNMLEKLEIEYSHLSNQKVIFYHNSWPYFTHQFGLKTIEFIEPKPGIMPSPAHLEKLIRTINNGKVKLIAMEPYFSDSAPKYLSSKTGIKYVRLAQSVNAIPEAKSYIEMFEYNLKTLSDILGK
jgi:zinc/manganese transport system substrate-binding protein